MLCAAFLAAGCLGKARFHVVIRSMYRTSSFKMKGLRPGFGLARRLCVNACPESLRRGSGRSWTGAAFGEGTPESPHSGMWVVRGLGLFLAGALRFGMGAFYSPHSRLGWRGTHTTPGCRPGLHEGAASQLYKDGL